MSIRQMTAVFDHSRATGSDRLVLLVIADRSDDDGAGCYRGKESIARMARVSRATVTRSIAHLVELGELEVDREGRDGRTNRYRITLNPAQSEPTHPAQSEPPTRLTDEPTPGSRGSRDPSPKPSNDPPARANALAREWWESYKANHQGRDPMQPFVAARGVIEKAIRSGWSDAQVRRALGRAGIPLTVFKLQQQLDRIGTSGAPDFNEQSRRSGIG